MTKRAFRKALQSKIIYRLHMQLLYFEIIIELVKKLSLCDGQELKKYFSKKAGET